MPFVYWTIAPSAGHARRQPGSSQCMHWSLRISHCSVPSSRGCSLNLIRFQKFHDVDGIVWYVLSNVVCWNGMSFHSTHATSHALQPMHVVTSMYLQTSSARCTPRPGIGPGCPEIAFICSVPLGMAFLDRSSRQSANARRRTAPRYALSSLTRNPLNSGVYAFGSITVGDNRFAESRDVRPSSSAIPR